MTAPETPPCTDLERADIELAYDAVYAGQRITFTVSLVAIELLDLDRSAGLRPTGASTPDGIEFEGQRRTGWWLASVVSTCINRRIMFAEERLKAGQVKALEALERELRTQVRRKTRPATPETAEAL